MDAKDPLPAITEILNECFNPRAEEHSSLATQLYFAGRQGTIVTELRRRAHHLIQGRMGTGKTMVLKFLSISSQLHDTAQIVKPQFIGIYIGLSPAWLHPLNIREDQARAQLFEKWVSLFTAECVIRELKNLPVPIYNVVKDSAHAHIASLLGLTRFASEEEFLDELESARDAIQDAIQSKSHESEKYNRLPQQNIHRFYGKMAAKLIQIFSSYVAPNACVFYLIDQFEHCSRDQQRVISQLLATSGATAPFFMKIGCRPHRPLSFPGIGPQDYRVVALEMIPSSTEYSRLATEIIALRFRAIATQLRAQGVPDRYTALFGSPLALFGNHSFELQKESFERQLKRPVTAVPVNENREMTAFRALLSQGLPRRFGGLTNIRLLSGGFVRTLLSLTFQVLRVALEQHAHPTLRKRKVALEIQDKAIRAEVQSELGPRLRAILSSSVSDSQATPFSESSKEQVETLLRRLVRLFHREIASEKTNPALLNFQFPFDLSEPQFQPLSEILHLLRDLGYVSGNFSVDQPTLSLSPLVSPWIEQLDLPPEALGVLKLTRAEAHRLTQPFVLSPAKIKQTIRAFYASGWRSPLERCVLAAMQEMKVASYNPETEIKFLVGTDPTGANHVIFEQLSELIKSSNYLIAEVSALNENVAFEIGLARAWRKRTYHLLNSNFFRLAESRKGNPRFINFIKGHRFFLYDLIDEGQPDLDSLKTAIELISQDHEAKRQKKRSPRIDLRESGKHNLIPYFHIESTSPAVQFYSDILNFTRRSLRREPLNPGPPDTRRSHFDHYADAIDRSTHVVIDISHGDPFACLLYGYALGTDRQVLPIWHSPTSGPITDIRALPDGGAYQNREHLLEGIIKPWLSGDDI